jgi:NAD(P)-dependent dehydrogenase (short-subunit alcohol dehydrogenase family)
MESWSFLSLDLSSTESCVRAAKKFLSKETWLDVVVANAAVSVAVGLQVDVPFGAISGLHWHYELFA